MAFPNSTSGKPSHISKTPRGEGIGADKVRQFARYEDDATGINVEGREPIDKRMPHLPPA